jgi:hypothetical protein
MALPSLLNSRDSCSTTLPLRFARMEISRRLTSRTASVSPFGREAHLPSRQCIDPRLDSRDARSESPDLVFIAMEFLDGMTLTRGEKPVFVDLIPDAP